LKAYSINGYDEIGQIKANYPSVKFIETQRTMEKHFVKPVVQISAMIDFAKSLEGDDYFLFTNSDIEIEVNPEILNMIEKVMFRKIIIANRSDYGEDKSNSQQYYSGIDVFFIHRKFLDIYPQSLYSIGQCFWDYWIPYMAVMNHVELALLENKIAFHKLHPLQYGNNEWHRIGQYFRWDNQLIKYKEDQAGIGQMSDYVFKTIYRNAKKIKIT